MAERTRFLVFAAARVKACVLTSMARSSVSLLLMSPSSGCGSSLEASIALLPRARVESSISARPNPGRQAEGERYRQLDDDRPMGLGVKEEATFDIDANPGENGRSSPAKGCGRHTRSVDISRGSTVGGRRDDVARVRVAVGPPGL